MTDVDGLNYAAFDRERDRLLALGYGVRSPADIGRVLAAQGKIRPCDTSASARPICYQADLSALLSCDALRVLPGWEHSRGSTLELLIATELHLPCYVDAELRLALDVEAWELALLHAQLEARALGRGFDVAFDRPFGTLDTPPGGRSNP